MDHGELGRRIAEASSDESRWPTIMGELAGHLGARGAFLVSPCEPNGVRSFGATVDLPPEMSEAYLGHYHAHDLLYQTARARLLLDAGSVVASQTLVPDDIYRRSVFYNEYLSRFGLYHCLGCVLTDERDASLGPRTHLAFWRPPEAAPFSAEETQRLNVVMPQLRLALTSHWFLRSRGLLGEWNEQLLAQIEQAFFLLGRGGQMLYANQAGLNLVRDSRALQLRNGILCRGENGTPLLVQFDALSAQPVDLAALPPDCPALRVVPLTQTQNTRSMFRWFPRAAYVVLPQPVATVRDDLGDHEFARRHGLTAAEQQVLSRLVEGKGPRDVAISQSLSVHTVRAHLAHIFAKTGYRNQRELLAAVMRARLQRG